MGPSAVLLSIVMHPLSSYPTDAPKSKRPPYRPPIGIPIREEGKTTGALISILLHTLVIALLLAPPFLFGALVANVYPQREVIQTDLTVMRGHNHGRGGSTRATNLR